MIFLRRLTLFLFATKCFMGYSLKICFRLAIDPKCLPIYLLSSFIECICGSFAFFFISRKSLFTSWLFYCYILVYFVLRAFLRPFLMITDDVSTCNSMICVC